MEFWPTPAGMREVRQGSINPEDICSAHQSFLLPGNGIVASIKYQSLKTILRSLPDSARDLAWLQEKLGPIPVVMYKESKPESLQQMATGTVLIQPDPEVAALWGCNTAEDFITELHKNGFHGICLDTNHLLRRHKTTNDVSPFAEDWENTVRVFMDSGLVRMVHLSIGRLDDPAFDTKTSIQEVRDFIESTDKTPAMLMMQKLKYLGFRGNIVLEVLSDAIAHAQRENLEYSGIIKAYANIRNTLAKIFST
jgi:hypothetical protein